MDTKIIIILLVQLYLARAESTYAEEVESFFQTFGGSGWQSCVYNAQGIMSKYEGDKKYAAGIINVYTQHCYYDSNEIFYRRLNEELRSGSPGEKWKTAGDLINRAIDIVGAQGYQKVYRGCSHDPGQLYSGHEFRYNQITSTSKHANTAGAFACGGTLFILKNVRGAAIERYSSYPTEGEVLVKSTVIFTVDGHPVTDASGIQKIKNEENIESSQLQRVIYLEWLRDTSGASTNGKAGSLILLVLGTLLFNHAATIVAF